MKIKTTPAVIALPTIYKKAKSGKALYWRAEVQGDKKRAASGQVGGKEQISAWTVCLPTNEGKKNARTASEQALEEANAERDLKLKNSGYHVSIDDINDAVKFVPMKAHTYNPKKPPAFPQIGQPKLNGYRMYATKDGLFTYGGTKIVTLPHIWEKLKDFFAKFPNALVDGEAYNHTHRELLNRIGSLVKTQTPTPELLEEAERVVQFHIFDGYINPSMSAATFWGRHDSIFASKLKIELPLVQVPNVHLSKVEAVRPWFEKLIADGYEGGILRDPSKGKYEQGRSHETLKYKPREDDEFLIKGGEDGNGKRAGHLASVTCVTKQGVEFKANVKWPDPVKKWLFDHIKELVNTKGTVSYAYLTEFGKPFHAYLEKVNIQIPAHIKA